MPAKKVQALLAYLALQPGRPHPRAKLATLLWSESSEAQARASLRQALLVLRRTLGLNEHELVTGPGETVELDAACIEVDAIAFERLVEDGSRRARARGLLWNGELSRRSTHASRHSTIGSRGAASACASRRWRCGRGCSPSMPTAGASSVQSTPRCGCSRSTRCRNRPTAI